MLHLILTTLTAIMYCTLYWAMQVYFAAWSWTISSIRHRGAPVFTYRLSQHLLRAWNVTAFLNEGCQHKLMSKFCFLSLFYNLYKSRYHLFCVQKTHIKCPIFIIFKCTMQYCYYTHTVVPTKGRITLGVLSHYSTAPGM